MRESGSPLAGSPTEPAAETTSASSWGRSTAARRTRWREWSRVGAPLETFDWDGARVAYGEERCIDAATVVAGPQEPTETFGPLACPVEILSDSARLARDNSLGIQVRCADGCDGGELGFSKPGYLHYNNTPGRFVRFRVAPGKTQTVRIRLSRRQAPTANAQRAPLGAPFASFGWRARDRLRCAGGTTPGAGHEGVACGFRYADQPPCLTGGHLQGPAKTVTQGTDHLLSLVTRMKAHAEEGFDPEPSRAFATRPREGRRARRPGSWARPRG